MSMRVLLKILQWIIDMLRDIGMISLMGMTFLTCADVIGRFFGHPIFGSIEIVAFLATIAVVTSLPYTHQARAHIGVEILVRLFSKKLQAIVELCTSFLSLILFALITWRMADYARTMQKSGEVSMSLEFPEYIIIYLVSFCFLIFFLVIIHDIVRTIVKLRENK